MAHHVFLETTFSIAKLYSIIASQRYVSKYIKLCHV